MITIHKFCARKSGPALLVFGAIHGNEVCGPLAITRIVKALQTGAMKLQKGSVTFVPVANPLAYARKMRYVKQNLNRVFRPTKNPVCEEAEYANVLCRLIEQCDAFLDIHSITAKGQPFTYLDYPTKNNRTFARILGPKIAVVGWPELYKKLGNRHRSFETTTYAAGNGKDCLLIECGQHNAPSSPRVAHVAILNAMRHYGLIEGKVQKHAFAEVRMTDAFFRKDLGDHLAKNWKHLDKVRKGDKLILHADGSITPAFYDAYIIMPKGNAAVGDDWLYLGRPGKG